MGSHLDPVPRPYRRALALEAEGLSHDQIAERLGVDPAAVPLLLRLAREKAMSDGLAGADGDAAETAVEPTAQNRGDPDP